MKGKNMFKIWFCGGSDEYFFFDDLAEYSEKYDFNASELVRTGKTEMLDSEVGGTMDAVIGGVFCCDHQGFSRSLSLCLES